LEIGETLKNYFRNWCKYLALLCLDKLIMASYYLRFQARSSRITVHCLQGEGKQRIVRPGTSLFSDFFLLG
jgi:hypothetical protein